MLHKLEKAYNIIYIMSNDSFSRIIHSLYEKQDVTLSMYMHRLRVFTEGKYLWNLFEGFVLLGLSLIANYYAALYAALTDLVAAFGENSVAEMARGLATRVNAGEFFEEHRLAFHHRHGREWADVQARPAFFHRWPVLALLWRPIGWAVPVRCWRGRGRLRSSSQYIATNRAVAERHIAREQ